jgi:hypothetical protein
MITVLTSFPLEPGTTRDAFKDRMLATVPRYQVVSGLLKKSYLFDPVNSSGGGVYTFESLSDAKHVFTEDMLERARRLFGSFEVRYLDTVIVIDNMARDVLTP